MGATEDTGEDLIEEIGPRTIRFPPVEYNGRSHDEITLKPLTIEMLLAAERKHVEIEKATTMIARSAGVPEQLVLKLSPKVIEKAMAYFGPFLPSAPPEAGDDRPAD